MAYNNKSEPDMLRILCRVGSGVILGTVGLLQGLSPVLAGEPALTTAQATALVEQYRARPVQPWQIPDSKALDQHPQAALIRQGMALLQQTTRLAGPRVADPSQRLARNNLNCVNCHEAGPSGLPGSKPYALPLVNAVNDYPKFDPKSMQVISLEQRIAGMFGKGEVALTPDHPYMQAIVAYLRWLGSEAQPGKRMLGAGLAPLTLPARAANPQQGAQLFAAQCAQCHGASGQGMPAADFATGGGYVFPPIAGDDSYDDGGHMYMVPLLTRFIHANMPLGSRADAPLLSVEQAYDIAAYVNSELARRHAPQRVGAYPDPALRPAGFAIPEHFSNAPEGYRRARFGPFAPDPE